MKFVVNWSVLHYLTTMVVLALGVLVEQLSSSDSSFSVRALGYTIFLGLIVEVVHTIGFQIIVLIPTFMARTYYPERHTVQSLVLLVAAFAVTSVLVAVAGIRNVAFYGGDLIVSVLLFIVYVRPSWVEYSRHGDESSLPPYWTRARLAGCGLIAADHEHPRAAGEFCRRARGWWVYAFALARLMALATARMDAVTMFSCTPAPHRTSSPIWHSTYAAARAVSPAVRACSV